MKNQTCENCKWFRKNGGSYYIKDRKYFEDIKARVDYPYEIKIDICCRLPEQITIKENNYCGEFKNKTNQ